MSRAAPETRAARSIIARILVQCGIQTKCENAVNPRPAGRGRDALAIRGGALAPLRRRVNLLEKSGIRGDSRGGPRSVGAFGMKLQLALPIERNNRRNRGRRNPRSRGWNNFGN